MWPINSYNSKYGKNDDKPIGHLTEDSFEVSIGITDDQILFLYINVVDLFDVQPSRSNEES